MKAGTWADPDFNGAKVYPAHGRTAVIDMNAGSPAWRETAPMANARAYQNLTLLPDGTVLASGGDDDLGRDRSLEAGPPRRDLEPRHRDVDDGRLRSQNGRLYHSTALLLPDGRVLMAGGGALPGRAQRPAERRDLLAAVPLQGRRARRSRRRPATIEYGAGFDVTTPDAAQHRQGLARSARRRSRTASTRTSASSS